MSDVKYLLDEHVDPRLQRGLVRHWPDLAVLCIGDPGAPPKGTPDPDILDWCELHGYVLVTNNRASMPVHLNDHVAAGKRCAGIIMLNPNLVMGDTINQLAAIWIDTTPEDHVNMTRYLSIRTG